MNTQQHKRLAAIEGRFGWRDQARLAGFNPDELLRQVADFCRSLEQIPRTPAELIAAMKGVADEPESTPAARRN